MSTDREQGNNEWHVQALPFKKWTSPFKQWTFAVLTKCKTVKKHM